MKERTTIRANQSGWVVYFGNDVANFKVFTSLEPERFIEFICENVANIKVDQLIQRRREEIERASKQFDKVQS
jgi:hypothetical protein